MLPDVYKRQTLNKFLWRAGYEFLQIEGFEIGHILEILFGYCLFCQRDHHAGKRADAVDEVCIGMRDFLFAFCCTVTEEIDGICLLYTSLSPTCRPAEAAGYPTIRLSTT